MRCPHCEQTLPRDFAEKRRKRRGENIAKGLERARQLGRHIGRPKSADHALIRELRKQGMSIRQIARRVCTSTSTVQYAIKERDL